jgi:hypothetical protein
VKAVALLSSPLPLGASGQMLPLYKDPHYTFRFADDRIIPRFHLEGVQVGQRVKVCSIDPATDEKLQTLTMGTVGEGGWVDLAKPIIVKGGNAFVAVVKPGTRSSC